MTTRYDTVRYSHHAFYQTHPDHLATVARLFGLETAPPQRARVLELGVSSGGNLIPMAARLPEASFYGVDLSESAVADAQASIHALGLRNIQVEARDILSLEDGFGTFDYILCHGVYSWVPAAVREKILSLCGSCLSENGVAYVSYNALPGWHLFNIARDVLRLHGERFADPMVQVEEGTKFLRLLAEQLRPTGAYGAALKLCEEFLQEAEPNYVYHDFFSPDNTAFLFRDFMEAALRQPLQFLGEAEFGEMFTQGLPEDLRSLVDQASQDLLTNEQYIDLVRCRTFRRTLLCRNSVKLRRSIQAGCLSGQYVALAGATVEAPSDGPLRLQAGGTTLSLHATEAQNAFQILQDLKEECISVEELQLRTTRDPEEANNLTAALVHAYSRGMVYLTPRPIGMVLQAGEFPLVDPWVRHQAASGAKRVVNLRHRPVLVDRFDTVILPFVDGTRSAAMLEEVVMEQIEGGRLEILNADRNALSREQIQGAIHQAIQTRLGSWGRVGFLLNN